MLERRELPRYFGRKLSPHQIDLRRCSPLAELRGTLPRDDGGHRGRSPPIIEMRTELSPRGGPRGSTRLAEPWSPSASRHWGHPRCAPRERAAHA